MGPDRRAPIEVAPAIEGRRFPADCCEPHVEQWITWKPTDDGRKIPRAPYAHPEQPDRYVSAQDSDVWTDFETARDWAVKLPGHNLAFVIRDRDVYPDEDLVLIDYDDARDADTGVVHPTVREHLARTASYADVSPSGSGVHILCRGALPEDVKTITDTLPADDTFPDASIEVYDSARYVAMTGRHLQATPRETHQAQEFLDHLADEYASVVAGAPDELLDEPQMSKAELAEIETTDEMQQVFDAIAQTEPADIQLRSPITEERSDGSKSRDPVWTGSDSGTRLAEVDDGWIYRDGMIGLDALQVVALEEGITTDERTYPKGKSFWDAVEALRDRGAHIPTYQTSPGTATPLGSTSDVDTDGTPDSRTTHPVEATPEDEGDISSTAEMQSPSAVSPEVDNPGDVDRALEVKLLRERMAELEARIDELEATLAEREATIEAQRDRLTALTSEIDNDEQDNSLPNLWRHMQRWGRKR